MRTKEENGRSTATGSSKEPVVPLVSISHSRPMIRNEKDRRNRQQAKRKKVAKSNTLLPVGPRCHPVGGLVSHRVASSTPLYLSNIFSSSRVFRQVWR